MSTYALTTSLLICETQLYCVSEATFGDAQRSRNSSNFTGFDHADEFWSVVTASFDNDSQTML